MKHLFTFFFAFLCISTGQFPATDAADDIQPAVDKAAAFLRRTQNETGYWGTAVRGLPNTPRLGIGPTTVILAGLLRSGIKADDPMIVKGLAFLEKATREDGGVYTPEGFFQNYETCCAVMCFAAADEALKKAGLPPKYKDLLAKAQKYLLKQQYTEERNVNKDEPKYGGVGYGGDTRPDLSNTQFFLDALVATGKDKDDPAIQKALTFVSRCQNLESEHNMLPLAGAVNDGGFVYVPTYEEPKGRDAQGGLRSYASMTYAGLKSMIYAGLTKDDKRVKAAYDWISKNYDVEKHPGREYSGLFYYYQTMAKALNVLQLQDITTPDGTKHNWRGDLVKQLLAAQQEDGSWVNDRNGQYMENDPHLVTGFALLVLADCRK
ncbi:MAG: terpene cyclase/mutase family protein [Planctomycetaceae bacterium]|jgi:squalene-hopene/tetraprenyl-beta-curcumene cyclase|nr:terpene cyclase/mutase family protein [Planctomycetaceae bacterium]